MVLRGLTSRRRSHRLHRLSRPRGAA